MRDGPVQCEWALNRVDLLNGHLRIESAVAAQYLVSDERRERENAEKGDTLLPLRDSEPRLEGLVQKLIISNAQ